MSVCGCGCGRVCSAVRLFLCVCVVVGVWSRVCAYVVNHVCVAL